VNVDNHGVIARAKLLVPFLLLVAAAADWLRRKPDRHRSRPCDLRGRRASVTDVARRYGVGRQTVHKWLTRYASQGLAGLVDRSCKPDTCPHQMPPRIEAKVLEMRRLHPQWGPRTILSRLARAGVEPLPSRSAIYRCLVRQDLRPR